MKFAFQAKDTLKAQVAKVVPTDNNGSSELVRVHHFKVRFILIYAHCCLILQCDSMCKNYLSNLLLIRMKTRMTVFGLYSKKLNMCGAMKESASRVYSSLLIKVFQHTWNGKGIKKKMIFKGLRTFMERISKQTNFHSVY